MWSYGEEVYQICEKYMQIREKMRGYTRRLMQEAHEKGTPVMRPLFYEFPQDAACWEIEDAYMYGDKLLVAPVLEAGAKVRRVWLPKGALWKECETGKVYDGGAAAEVAVTLESMPVFLKMGKEV